MYVINKARYREKANVARDGDQHQSSWESVLEEQGTNSEGLFAPHTVSLQSYFYAIACGAVTAAMLVWTVPNSLCGIKVIIASSAVATRSSMQITSYVFQLTNKTAFARWFTRERIFRKQRWHFTAQAINHLLILGAGGAIWERNSYILILCVKSLTVRSIQETL